MRRNHNALCESYSAFKGFVLNRSWPSRLLGLTSLSKMGFLRNVVLVVHGLQQMNGNNQDATKDVVPIVDKIYSAPAIGYQVKRRSYRVTHHSIIHRWKRKLGADSNAWLKILFIFCLFTSSGCILLGLLNSSHRPSHSPIPKNAPSDLMQGLLLHPEISAQSGDNFRLWPYEVTNVNFRTTLMPQQPCRGDTFLVIFVHTRPHFSESRNAIRRSWGSVARTRKWPGMDGTLPPVEIYFVTAESPGNPSVAEQLEAESAQHQDIIKFDFVDSYFNLTLKSLMDLKWFHEHCSHAQYLAKADDDVFIDVGRLVNLLQVNPHTTNAILGDRIHYPKLYRDHPKWAVPHHRFSGNMYPDYMKGTTYVLTPDLPAKMLAVAPYVLPIHVDDVYISGILAQILRVDLIETVALRVLERVGPDPCLIRVLGKVVTIGTVNPLLIKHQEESDAHTFQFVLWDDLHNNTSRWRCHWQAVYWRFIHLIC